MYFKTTYKNDIVLVMLNSYFLDCTNKETCSCHYYPQVFNSINVEGWRISEGSWLIDRINVI